MSGLVAVAAIGPRSRSDRDLAIAAKAMAEALLHRGDARDVFAGESAAMVPLGGRVAIRGPLRAVADARLDRRVELARRLGVDPAAVTDTEMLLAGWDLWGEAVVDHADGDYAAAIWDLRERTLVLLRDPLGVRPLYVARHGDVVLVASEVHALERAGWLPPLAFDRVEAARYLLEDHAEDGPTVFAGVETAQAGGVTRWTGGRTVRRRIWRPDPFARSPGDADACAERLREALDDAVRSRLPAAGDAAVLVSGGLDSSSVACLAARTRPAPRLLHLAFPGSSCDESAHFAAVAAATGGTSVEVNPRTTPAATSPDAARIGPRELYEATLSILEPLLDAAALAPGAVVLTGIGGDDLLHSTGHECADALHHGRLRVAVAEAGAWRRGAGAAARHLAGQAARALVPGAVQDALRRRVRTARRLWPAWLADDVREQLHAWHLDRMEARRRVPAPSEVQRRLVLLLTGDSDLFLVLSRLDRFAARRGVDLRHPFYDRRVVELLLATPADQRARGTDVKQVLRTAMRGVLPEPIRTRTDAADFTPWTAEVVTGPHHDAYRAAFSHSHLERQGIVRPGALLELLGRGALAPVLKAIALEVAMGHPRRSPIA